MADEGGGVGAHDVSREGDGASAIDPWVYYWLSVAVLAALLFLPASRLIWVLSVRRLERKGGRALSDAERRGQLNRARFLAVLFCLAFSALFNYRLLGMSDLG